MKCLFLDFDGTIADSLPVWRAVYDNFLTLCGKSGSAEEFESMNGFFLPRILSELQHKHNLSADFNALRGLYEDLIRRHFKGVPVFSDFLPFLRRVKEDGISCWIVSAASGDLIRAFSQDRGFYNMIDGFVTAENCLKGKPEPDIFLVALSNAGVIQKKDVIVVEDSLNGLLSAQRAGLQAIQIDHYGDRPRMAPAFCRVSSFNELLERIKQIWWQNQLCRF
jgi:beta-phosphoglucomutase-like phosphatase (HAD superfamily)